ncbi:MAG: SAM-dependent methyltransferase [Bradyrhizobiaceae bacterium]|nr:SAM-dependent methyltransferase [Bradyrhizobiaceae bacterium]
MVEHSPLVAEIRRRIAVAGPMPVSQFMDLCLSHPEYGYYVARDPIGSHGDFITAPEISQIFGELIGLWAAEVWRLMGKPADIHLIELGPGRGTLMLDALRASRAAPRFREALAVHLVETSPALRRRQRETLADFDAPIFWHGSLSDIPAGPVIVLANEFFDALPIHQAIKQSDGWHERVVELDKEGDLTFGLAAAPLPSFDETLPHQVRQAPVGAIYEWRPDHVVGDINRRILQDGGAALVIDYGHAVSAAGDTLQAVRCHAYSDPLAEPGLADLTAHVDFEALASSARSAGVRTLGPIEQAAFLRRIGIDIRAAALKAVAPTAMATKIDTSVARLTAGGRTGMGALFKVMALSHPALALLPGFDSST